VDVVLADADAGGFGAEERDEHADAAHSVSAMPGASVFEQIVKAVKDKVFLRVIPIGAQQRSSRNLTDSTGA
jgi:hypothetical protein